MFRGIYDFLILILQQKPPAGKKKATVLGSKIAPNQRVSGQRNVVSAAASSSSVPNKLDSTAPSKRRGKERENPKKKRKTILKKLILEARERRKLELERQRASPEPDLQEVIEAGEQVDEEDDEVGKEKKTAADDEMEEMKEASNEEGTTGATVEPAAGKTNLEMSKVDEDSPEFKARRELHSRKFRE